MPRPRVPASVTRLALQLGPAVYPVVRRLAEHGRWRQLAIVHARRVRDGRFSSEQVDGRTVWVVWAGDDPIAAYPEVEGELTGRLTRSRPERRRDPLDLPVQRVARRVSDATRRTPSIWSDPPAPRD